MTDLFVLPDGMWLKVVGIHRKDLVIGREFPAIGN